MNKLVYTLSFLTLFLMVSCGEDTPVNVVSAEQDLDSLLLVYPDSVPLLVERGNKMIKEYNYQQALADGAKAFRLDSSNYDARLLYADALNNKPGRSVADVASAQRHYKLIVKKQPKNTKALIGLAASYRQQQDFESTFKYVNEALRIDPKNRDAYVLKGSTYVFMGNYDLAKSSYETAVQQDPEFYVAYIMLGNLYQADSNEICIEYFTTASKLKPDDMDAVYALAYAKHDFKDIEGAKELYRKMASDTADYYVSRGLFHQGYIKQFTEKDLDSAMYFYNSALTTNPMYAEAWYNLGLCYQDKGENTRALQSYSKTLKYARQNGGYTDEFIAKVEKQAESAK